MSGWSSRYSGWAVLLTAASLMWGGADWAQAEDIYVRNRPFEQIIYVDSEPYAPLTAYTRALRVRGQLTTQGRIVLSFEPAKRKNEQVPQNDLLNAVPQYLRNISATSEANHQKGSVEPAVPSETVEQPVQNVEPSAKVFEAEYDGLVFPVPYIWYEEEPWVPVGLLAKRLGFRVEENSATGIIDILVPRLINENDRTAAQELEAEKEAKLKEAEGILQKRHQEKIKKQKEAEERARQEEAKRREEAAKKPRSSVERRRVTVSDEGDFPSEFNSDPSLYDDGRH